MATIRTSGRRQDSAAADLDRAIAALDTIATDIVTETSRTARQAILSSVASRRGLSMSGLGATLDIAVAAVAGGPGHAETTMRASPAGAWAIADSGAQPHTITTARGMPTPYGVFRKVNHPGSPAGNIWEPACDQADQAADQIAETTLDRLPGD